ncbi:hypothetical protein I6F33_36950 [Bradyrhizobium sp. BRP20]|uniref:hypothetical protein n=1 Tax=unclassified Bradyrhizobium TaxID=2631580 RepID=UPI001CD1CFC9|nr:MULTISPECIES: hypothetical protein [unclassified Bradyrhizobium]MCA1438475.1 hypothetical protein [Bradyrhizobium sp. BRP20]MCA1470741.1 hypothetical protein [Bradyrhizobium sp. IC3195]MCA1552203.1 hypothetical protein [Bradyrhizobium sp. BRP19]
MTQLEPDPIAAIFARIEGDAYAEFLSDVSENGVREAVGVFKRNILDGRNRYRAAVETGADCPTRNYYGDDPLGYVISLNLKRRHRQRSEIEMLLSLGEI